MKIAVASQGPRLDSDLEPSFGQARYLVVFDTESGEFGSYENRDNIEVAQGVGLKAALDLVCLGVDAVATVNIAPQAASVLEAGEVEVFTDAWGNVADAIEEYLLRPVSGVGNE